MPAAGADLVSASYTRAPQESEKPMWASVFTPACFIFSTIALIINGAGCGNVTIHAPSAPGRSALAMAISGVFVSRTTLAMASVAGAPAEPMMTSTLSSSISLRALRAAGDGAGASSGGVKRPLWAPHLRAVGQRGLHALVVCNAERRHRPRQRGDEADFQIGGLCARSAQERSEGECANVAQDFHGDASSGGG